MQHDYSASEQVGHFLLDGKVRESTPMFMDRIPIRNARMGVIGTLVLGCSLISVAGAQDSSVKTATARPATHKHTAATKVSASSKKHSRRKKSSRVRGQQKIDSERALAIQEALIREHYLKGTPTGTWNEASQEAMRRYQADNGWQSKTVPDSRALIKLGLGPSKDHLLNPESAMTTVPAAPKADPAAPTSHTSPAAASPVPAGSPPSPTPTSDSSSPQ